MDSRSFDHRAIGRSHTVGLVRNISKPQLCHEGMINNVLATLASRGTGDETLYGFVIEERLEAGIRFEDITDHDRACLLEYILSVMGQREGKKVSTA
jgi:hypothetical protein